MDKEKLFEEYSRLCKDMCRIDKILADKCREEIHGLLERKEYDKAKAHVRSFYATQSTDFGSFDSFEKDLIYYSINLKMKM